VTRINLTQKCTLSQTAGPGARARALAAGGTPSPGGIVTQSESGCHGLRVVTRRSLKLAAEATGPGAGKARVSLPPDSEGRAGAR
jgi:hypothetical protein